MVQNRGQRTGEDSLPESDNSHKPGSSPSEEKRALAEKITRAFVNTIRQITPNYQRRILLFLAKNRGRKFTNIQISQALDDDRSNIWRFMNNLIEESGEHSLISKIIEGNDIYYSWNEPDIKIDGLMVSEILRTLAEIEALAKEREK